MSASKYIDRRLTTVAVLLTITISKWVCTKFFSGDRKTFQKMNSEIQNMNHKKISLSVFTQNINSPLARLCGHLWPLVHNTVSRKQIIVRLLVHSNNWNITSGTRSCTLPVNFDHLVHSITLQKKRPMEKPLRFRVSFFFWYRDFNSCENPWTKTFFWKILKPEKILRLKITTNNSLQDFLFQIVWDSNKSVENYLGDWFSLRD